MFIRFLSFVKNAKRLEQLHLSHGQQAVCVVAPSDSLIVVGTVITKEFKGWSVPYHVDTIPRPDKAHRFVEIKGRHNLVKP